MKSLFCHRTGFFYALAMEKTIKTVAWIILGLLSLAMGFLLIARYTPALMLKIVGTNGRPGQLAKICECNDQNILIEEIIDNDSGIGVEGGAGFSVQLKKLLLVDLQKMASRKIGLHINTIVIGCSRENVWLFDHNKGIHALATQNGELQIDQEKILERNPALQGRLSGTVQDFNLSLKSQELMIEDTEHNYWHLDRNFLAHRLNSKPATAEQQSPNRQFEAINHSSLFYPILLLRSADTSLILHYKNKLREGLRLTRMKAAGHHSWQQNLDSLLDRKQEKCRPVAIYQDKNKILLILDTSRGTRLIWLDSHTGRCIKNQRV